MVEAAGIEPCSRRSRSARGYCGNAGGGDNQGDNRVSGGVVWGRFETGWGRVELAEFWRRLQECCPDSESDHFNTPGRYS